MTKTMVTVYYPNGELQVFEKDDPALMDALLYKYAKIGAVTDIPNGKITTNRLLQAGIDQYNNRRQRND